MVDGPAGRPAVSSVRGSESRRNTDASASFTPNRIPHGVSVPGRLLPKAPRLPTPVSTIKPKASQNQPSYFLASERTAEIWLAAVSFLVERIIPKSSKLPPSMKAMEIT